MTVLLLLYVTAAVLLAGLSIPLMLRKIPPNSLYGFRVPKTLNDPKVWYEANAYSGKRLLVFSLVLLAAAAGFHLLPGIDETVYALSVLAVVVIGLAAAVIQSFRYLSRL